MEAERVINIIDKSKDNSVLKSGSVTVIQTPITERYCKVGDVVTLDLKHKKIRCGGAWFYFDERWVVETYVANCVCSLSNSNGESVYKIFGEKLAKQWNLYRIFTGTHKQCLDFMQANGY